MSSLRVPTPLRPYTGGAKEVEVRGDTVAASLQDLTARYPDLRRHLFDDAGALRPYINVFLNEDDVRTLQGEATHVSEGDRLMIVPSIAGGAGRQGLRPVDHAALRANQAFIIGLLAAGFVANAASLVPLVGLVMLIGTAAGRPGFLPAYRVLRRAGALKPDVIQDNPEPHRFAQGLGGAVLVASSAGLLTGHVLIGWALAWVVIGLAALNLFAGFCVGCAVYYWFNRIGVPGFAATPPPDTLPGRRPQAPQT
jgi:molybdopterin converting factor small subunit